PLGEFLRQPLWRARDLRLHRRCRLLQLPAAGLASARRIDWRTGGPQDMGRSGAKPADRSLAIDHDLAGLGTVRRLYLSGPVADAADPGKPGCDRPVVCDLRRVWFSGEWDR